MVELKAQHRKPSVRFPAQSNIHALLTVRSRLCSLVIRQQPRGDVTELLGPFFPDSVRTYFFRLNLTRVSDWVLRLRIPISSNSYLPSIFFNSVGSKRFHSSFLES